MHVSALFVYPVKSLRGCPVASAAVDALGIVCDRRFLVVDDADRFLTQRVLPAMATIETAIHGDALVLSRPTRGSVRVPLQSTPGSAVIRKVTIWKSEGLLAEDCGDGVARWLSDALGTRCRLVRAGSDFNRPVLKATARPGDVAAFTDVYPFMAVSEASLGDLNERLLRRGDQPVPMNRFRPSFVISGCDAYAEDTWPRVKVGPLLLRAGGACARCIVTTTDQETGARGREPLALLSNYRRDASDPTRINFGQNFYHETKTGTIQVGDSITPLA